MQNILQEVREAFWQALGAQRLTRDAEELDRRAREALERSREAEIQGVIPPQDALTYQRLLLDTMSLISARREEMYLAKSKLMANTCLSLIQTD